MSEDLIRQIRQLEIAAKEGDRAKEELNELKQQIIKAIAGLNFVLGNKITVADNSKSSTRVLDVYDTVLKKLKVDDCELTIDDIKKVFVEKGYAPLSTYISKVSKSLKNTKGIIVRLDKRKVLFSYIKTQEEETPLIQKTSFMG